MYNVSVSEKGVAKMKKFIISLFLALALTVIQIGPAFAQDTTSISGTVQDVTIETDAITGEKTVAVTLVDANGATQTVNLSVDEAVSLGLVTLDPATGEPSKSDTAIGSEVIIDMTEPTIDEKEHPAGSSLSDFFSDILGVDYEMIMGYHDEGAGFGVIAQALWITNQMDGDTTLFQAIMDAKLNGDYSGITLEDGSTPKNWGQLKNAVLKGEKDNSLGDVKSRKAGDKDKGGKDKGKDKDNKGNDKEGKGNKGDKSDKGKGKP